MARPGGGRLRIGELARRSGVTAKAIRFYEARGVLPPAARGPNGYRLYDDEAVEMLRFVRQAGRLGLRLGEIREIVAIRQGGKPPCAHVRRLLGDKMRELEARLADLIELRKRLGRSLAASPRASRAGAIVCPHIEAEAGATPARVRRGGQR